MPLSISMTIGNLGIMPEHIWALDIQGEMWMLNLMYG